jgi:hypothetical protein
MTISDEDRAALRDIPTERIVEEIRQRRDHDPALGPHALEIRLRCMEMACRFWVPGQPAGTFAGLAATLEQYVHAGPDKWFQGRSRPGNGMAPEARAERSAAPPPAPKPPPEPDLTPKDIMALCLEIEAEAQRAGVGFFDLCTRHGINATSFQSWANGSVMPRDANIRKLQRIRRDGVVPQRQNGVDRDAEREPAPEGKAP